MHLSMVNFPSSRQRLSCGACHPETPALQVFVEGFWKAVRGLEIGRPLGVITFLGSACFCLGNVNFFVRQQNVHLKSVASKAMVDTGPLDGF